MASSDDPLDAAVDITLLRPTFLSARADTTFDDGHMHVFSFIFTF